MPSTLPAAADKAGFYLLAACAVLAPVPYGSNSSSAAAFIGLLLAVALLAAPFVPSPSRKARDLIRALLLLSLFVVSWSVVQTFAWWPDPTFDPVTAAGLPAEIGTRLHAAPHLQSLQSAGYVLIPVAGFIAALTFVRDSARYARFLQIVLGISAAVAFLSLAQYLISPRTLLFGPKSHYLGSFTGTFINPNTAATHFGILLLLALALALHQRSVIQTSSPRTGMAKRRYDIRLLVMYSVAAFVFALALLSTKSRAGILSSLIAVVVYTWAAGFSSRRTEDSKVRLAGIGTLSAALAVGVFFLYGGLLLERLRVEGFDDGGRICTYQATWEAIKDNLWLGTGLGTFQDVFPAYRRPECGLYGYWEMAHSVFLEAWLALGMAFFICLAVIYYQLIKSYAAGLLNRRQYRFVPLVSLCITLLLTLHSLVDFSLQIPGVAVVAAIVLGAGAGISLAPARVRKPSRSPRPSPSPAAQEHTAVA